MKPITHAKIKYFTITLSYLPKAIGFAAKVLWLARSEKAFEENKEKINKIVETVAAMSANRKLDVRRCYNFHKNGYEFVIKQK